MISYHVMHHRILGIGKYPAGVSGSGIASALWLLPSYVCKGLYIYSMGRFSNFFFFYLLLFCFCESCVMRVLQSKGVADHIERHIEILTELTRRERECFYCVSAPLKQSYSKSHLNGNTEDNKQEMKMRITSVFFLIPRGKEKNAITGQTAQGGSKRWFLSKKSGHHHRPTT